MGFARASLAREQARQSVFFESCLHLVEETRENPNDEAAWLTAALSTLARRNISYLTCTRSRGSKKSFSLKRGSAIFSGCGFNVPCFSQRLQLGRIAPRGLGHSYLQHRCM